MRDFNLRSGLLITSRLLELLDVLVRIGGMEPQRGAIRLEIRPEHYSKIKLIMPVAQAHGLHTQQKFPKPHHIRPKNQARMKNKMR